MALVNDLHKGRDTRKSWSILIDVFSVITVFVSVTGLLLNFFNRRKRMSGLITAVVSTGLLIAIVVWLVP